MKSLLTDRNAGRHGAPSARAPGDFWEDFRARAELAPQAAPARAVPGRLLPAWAAAAAVAAVVAGAVLWRGAPAAAASPAILSLSVGAEDGSVFILRDDATAAVIVWVDDGAGAGG